MATPNSALRAARMGLLMSQDDFARAIRDAGTRAGQPNDANKRLVQRWESGITTSPRPIYARALEAVTGLPIEALGFTIPVPMARISEDGHGGHDMEPAPGTVAPTVSTTPQPEPQAAHRNYSGVWLSRYEYFSSGRDAAFTGLHYVVLLQHGSRLTARSLPNGSTNPNSPLTMDLEIDGHVATGTWTEQTASEGYYRGARYHGAIQLLVEPTGRRMTGKWVGFGKEFDVNTGPWELVFQDASTAKATLAAYDRPPEA
ncbi:XRE family transcriptional regulator [Streptomyces sp. NPDC004629]|uniref:XRE family transcriptional regulator n=1 Tax=Streptomyces sp. NPDC004629 TaxID=3364705 RepID=UPI0036BCBA85